MFGSLRTGKVIDERWLRFSFPTFWRYDVLRRLDYLRDAEIKPDSRGSEAIKIVMKRRHQNGRWPLNLSSSRAYSIGDGDRCRQRQPLEPTARSPSAASV
jgi:hypothetical protein